MRSDHGAACSPVSQALGRVGVCVPSGMSGLQPGFALNEKQAGRLRPAPRAVWAGPLGTGRRRGGHTGCAWRASHQHGRLGGLASRFRPAPAGRQRRRSLGPWQGTALEADGAGPLALTPEKCPLGPGVANRGPPQSPPETGLH
ncbi:unnamed protein product [Rangifer tarandus platyrhynchus]|uniref:Uncharacterized protein n=1 Tax=Rangifer tarandus platyrhynchus TaxID=3082113 RepID=A0AC59YKI2_RANTA